MSFVDADPVKETIMDGLRRPWSMSFISENVALLAEKDGDLLRVNLLTKTRVALTGIPEDLADTLSLHHALYRPGEFPGRSPEGLRTKYNAGLFQVLVDPDFESNQRIFLSYAADAEGGSTTKVISAILKVDRLTNIKTLLVASPYSAGLFHYGGGMVFGQDGKLYITIGERLFSEALQPDMPIAQDLQDRRGKIYRLNPDGSVPDDNPVFEEDTPPGLFALGIRAAQGLALDPATGDIWFSEHGTNQGDELNLLKSGANYGWPTITTGTYRGPGYSPPKLEDRAFTHPIWYWRHTIAPTGLTFYTGNDFPTWKGDLIVPGLSAGNFWRLRIKDQKVESLEEIFVNERDRTRNAIQSPEGKLYILTDEVNGRIIRIKNRNNATN